MYMLHSFHAMIIWILALVHVSRGEQIFDCPPSWITFEQHCYSFVFYPTGAYDTAKAECEKHGASLMSVNTAAEHAFISQQLMQQDISRSQWYTSGLVVNMDAGDMRWEGEGTIILPDRQFWLSEADKNEQGNRIVYKYGGLEFGWSRSPASTPLPYICEISSAEAYRIVQEYRDFTYGTDIADPNKALMGPTFMIEPLSRIVMVDAQMTSIECLAYGNPPPAYRMYRTTLYGNRTHVTSSLDTRYTLSNGKLQIEKPTESQDSGTYQCVAENQFGMVYSVPVPITFGTLGEFANVIRAPVVAKEHDSANIECLSPSFKPAVVYQWRKAKVDFVRPDLNPHLFISSNGKLYFSEVNLSDEGEYLCIVKLTSGNGAIMDSTQPPSRTSLPIRLVVNYADPKVWGPEISNDFINVFPNVPMRGQTVLLECLAYGALPLTYSWRREGLSMPSKIYYTDHKRILHIPNAQLEDGGIYVCHVARSTVAFTEKAFSLQMQSKPYFVFPLRDQHVDIGSQLTWRCEARAVPPTNYLWFKNGQVVSVKPGEIDINQNVMTIRGLDPAKHNGMYQCAAGNLHGTTFSSAQLRVLGFAPTFKKRPLDEYQIGAIGGNVTIVCAPEAAPYPTFSWSKDRIPLNLQNGDTTSRVRKLLNGNLFITNMNMADSGSYTCTAENIYGSNSSTGTLTVTASSAITVGPVNEQVLVNTTAFLRCQGTIPGIVDYVYTWNFNGERIDFHMHKHYRLGTMLGLDGLYITNAQYSHTGIYECILKTTRDSARASAYLTVIGPPGEPVGVRVDPTSITPNTARLTWIPGEPHGLPAVFYIIEAKTEANPTWIVLHENVPDTETVSPGVGSGERRLYTVQGLKPSNGYYFRVKGVSAYGVGLPSLETTAYQTPGGKPLVAPENVGGGGGAVGILTITWTPLPHEDWGGPWVAYTVYWRLKSQANEKWSEVNVTSSNSGLYAHTVGKEFYYLRYEVKVRPYNQFGIGPESDISVIFSAEDLPIGVATNVMAYPYNSTAILVTWDVTPNVRENMKGTLLGYQVNYWERFGVSPIMNAISWRGETSSGIAIGLKPNLWYTVNVQVLNTAGMGPISEVAHIRTYKRAPSMYPTEIYAYSHTAGSVRVVWRGVHTDTKEETLEGYTLRYWPFTEDIRTAKDVKAERLETEKIIYGIQMNTVYELRIFAVSRGGDGVHSQSVFFTRGGSVAIDPSSTDIVVAGGVGRLLPSAITAVVLLTIVAFL